MSSKALRNISFACLVAAWLVYQDRMVLADGGGCGAPNCYAGCSAWGNVYECLDPEVARRMSTRSHPVLPFGRTFCKVMLQKPNVLIFDEPTNHLDLESINALNIALQKYEGTVFIVTHDEDVMDEVGTRIWSFADGEIEDWQGTFEDWQEKTGNK